MIHGMAKGDRKLAELLGENIAKLMDASGWSEQTVATKGRISQRSVNRAKNGVRVRIDIIEGIAKAFNIHPWQLLVPGLDLAKSVQQIEAPKIKLTAEHTRIMKDYIAAPPHIQKIVRATLRQSGASGASAADEA